ncbi:Gfo/Idh/MocA family oxidoreductase [Ravibacter arvi]|uniref:Gfo/Idh/MocA family oxidoreductase n=1 Tax=Ravibacter arvi TaxID=2051041 RepID=A0ABP8LWJ4_9BACT
MKNTFQHPRRTFIKSIGLATVGLGPASALASPLIADPAIGKMAEKPAFNMSGYAAPKLEKIRLGIIGLGNRGMAALQRMLRIEGVEIVALCDLRESQVAKGREYAAKAGQKPTAYHTEPDAWKKMCERKDLDLVYILTPWNLHTPQAVFSMNHGKHVFVEVPAATTLEECWALVNTSEKTKKHCIQVENCCYDFTEMMVLNMAQQGYFGEIIHAEGAYIHDLAELFLGDRFYQKWELQQAVGKMGNLYPTHGLGPICQVMNINRGDRMEYLVSTSTNDFTMAPLVKEKAENDNSLKPFVGKAFNGNMNTTTIRTLKGKTMVVQYDVSSVRPYSRIHLVSGTKGAAQKFPLPARIANSHEWLSEKEYQELEEKFTPPIIKKIGEIAKKVGGHGGMDFLMDWRNIDCIRNGLAMDQDVYDAALWSSITPLSIASVANRSNSVDVPDFTRGNWKTNAPVDLSLKTGATTQVKE